MSSEDVSWSSFLTVSDCLSLSLFPPDGNLSFHSFALANSLKINCVAFFPFFRFSSSSFLLPHYHHHFRFASEISTDLASLHDRVEFVVLSIINAHTHTHTHTNLLTSGLNTNNIKLRNSKNVGTVCISNFIVSFSKQYLNWEINFYIHWKLLNVCFYS